MPSTDPVPPNTNRYLKEYQLADLLSTWRHINSRQGSSLTRATCHFFPLFNWLSIWILFVIVIEEQSSEMVLKQVYRVWFRGSPNLIRWPCEHAFLLKQKFTSNKIPAVIEEIRLVPPTCCETRVHRYVDVALDVYFAKTPIWNSVRHHLLVLHTGCVL